MSEQENTGGETKDRMSPVVVVESESSKHTLPYKITDLQDVGAPDLHQKCASSEKHKPIAKKLSSNLTSKRRGSPLPTAIPMTPLDSQGKAAETTLALPVLPIPVLVRPGFGVDKDKEEIEVGGDDDSITSEIAELRTPPVANESSDWENNKEKIIGKTLTLQENSNMNVTENHIVEKGSVVETCTSAEANKKKEISWPEEANLAKNFTARSATWMLERKASIGPCFKRGTPSGITVCLHEKYTRAVKSGITIIVSKKSSDYKFTGPVEFATIRKRKIESEMPLKIKESDQLKYCSCLRNKLDGIFGRIKHVLHI